MKKEGRSRLAMRKVRTQRDVLRDVMLSANECDAWLTLAELSAMTRYPAASISAQLRHLRKPAFGNFEIEKQMRLGASRTDGLGTVWEYRMTRRRRVGPKRRAVGVKREGQRAKRADGTCKGSVPGTMAAASAMEMPLMTMAVC